MVPVIVLPTVADVSLASPADDIARLYALPPAGSVYVRVVNPEPAALSVQFGADTTEEKLSPTGNVATDYRVVPGGRPLTLRINGQSVSTDSNMPATGFVTLVAALENGKPAVKPIADDSQGADGLKAELALYNLVPGCTASVSVPDGPTVFSKLAFQMRDARAINPVEVALIADCTGKRTAPLKLPRLNAGDRYSLFLVGTASTPTLMGQVNRTQPYRAP